MRLNHYRFPATVDAHTRFKYGAKAETGICEKGIGRCGSCPFNAGEGWFDCEFYKCLDADDTIGGITITEAKKLLKLFGGEAWTEHLERDGGCFECTEIKLAGNNSRHKYNRHL